MNKIIKYDFLSTNKPLSIVYFLSILSTIIVLISGNYKSDFAIASETVTKDFALICLLITLIVPFFRCFFKIKNTLYKSEGYLTNTLPIKSGTLYDGKMLSAIFSLILSWIVFGVCFLSSFSGMNIIKLFVNVANNVNMLSMSISIISLLVTQLLFIFMCMIVGLVIGYRFNENRDIKTFLIFVALYIVSRIIMVLIIGSLNLDYYLYSTLFFIILNLLFYFYGRELFKKGVNLE